MCFPKRTSRLGLLVGLGLLLAVGGVLPKGTHAQTRGSNPVRQLQKQFEADSTLPSSSAALVTVETRLARTPVPAGESVRAAVVLDVKTGWHVNAHAPTLDYLIGTTIDWSSPPSLTVHQVRYPEPTRLKLDFAGKTLDVYEGTSSIFLTIRPTASAPPGERRLTGRLRVQACNDQTCLRPSTITTTLTVPVARAGASSSPTGDPIFTEEHLTPVWGTIRTGLRRHGMFAMGTLLILATVVALLIYRRFSGEG